MLVPRFAVLLTLFSSVSAFLGTSRRVFGVASLAAGSSAATETMSEVKVGDKLPDVNLIEGLGNFENQEVNLLKLIAGKKVVIFGVPGAFTPGCSKSHLPSFIDAQNELKAKGIEMTICIATNDVYVMDVSHANRISGSY